MGYSSKTISLTLPKDLLAQIDQLADREMASRSEIIRRATIKYVREVGIERQESKETLKLDAEPARDFKELAAKHPGVPPQDHELLAFLDDYDNNRL